MKTQTLASLSTNVRGVMLAGELLQRLAAQAGNGEKDWDQLSDRVRQVVNDPLLAKQVWLAMTGQLVIDQKMTKDEWVERELNILKKIDELGLELGSFEKGAEYDFTSKYSMKALVERAWQEGLGPHDRFVPAGLTREMLLTLCERAGVKVGSDYQSGEELPTQAGVFDCDLTTIMQPVDADHRPFTLDYDQHIAWSMEQGGNGLSSLEEVLYLILRMKLEFGRLLFLGGRIRCRNKADHSDDLGYLRLMGKDGLSPYLAGRPTCDWACGCVPRKFTALEA